MHAAFWNVIFICYKLHCKWSFFVRWCIYLFFQTQHGTKEVVFWNTFFLQWICAFSPVLFTSNTVWCQKRRLFLFFISFLRGIPDLSNIKSVQSDTVSSCCLCSKKFSIDWSIRHNVIIFVFISSSCYLMEFVYLEILLFWRKFTFY